MFVPDQSCCKELFEKAEQFAAYPFPVLILGESGVGKEYFAKRIHEKSQRRDFSFVPVNCAALPSGLVESELFGHEKGAFSGAVHSYRGLVRAAHQGSLFLDEIGELDLASQAKLLRVIDNKEVRAVGSQKFEKTDARIIAATNVNMAQAVQEKSFRLDLFERLCVLTLQVPPLRERKDEIIPFAKFFLSPYKAEVEWSVLDELLAYHWPGNLRQLRNVMLRSLVLSRGKIEASHIKTSIEEEQQLLAPHGASKARAVIPMEGSQPSLEDIERKAILTKLEQCRGNRKIAAKELGIAKSTLHEKLRKWKHEGIINPWLNHPRYLKSSEESVS